MTNFDKWEKTLNTSTFGVNKYTGVPFECSIEDCDVCIFNDVISCAFPRMEWLKKPYKEGMYETMSHFLEEIYNKLCQNDCDSCIIRKIQHNIHSTNDCRTTLLKILLRGVEK